MTKRSRLYRRLESETRRNFYLSLFGIAVILLLVIKFGPPLLVNLSLFLSGSKQSSLPIKNTTDFLMAPVLNPLPTATNSAKFTLSGKADPQAMIEFYLNSNLVDKTQADKNGNFSFDSMYVKGDNKIYVLAKIDNKSSNPSDTLDTLYINSQPTLTISSPSDGQQFTKDQSEISVTGSTDPQVKVTVNGYWAIVDQSNNFNYKLKLQSGDNTIKIEAEDLAGNKTEKEIKVKYSS